MIRLLVCAALLSALTGCVGMDLTGLADVVATGLVPANQCVAANARDCKP